MGLLAGGTQRRQDVPEGAGRPDEEAVAKDAKLVGDLFERFGKEEAPVEYDAEWIISRSHEQIRPKVRELIELLRRELGKKFAFEWLPGQFRVRYRGVRCVNPHIQLRQIWVRVTHKGWVRGMRVTPWTYLEGPEFLNELRARIERTRRAIDAELDARRGPAAGP
jgi:hypothetical protein